MSKYNMEDVLQYVSSNYVTVNEGEMRNTKPRLAEILDTVTGAMKEVNPLFKEMFETYLYGGSTYDGLKVGKPDEFDIDLKLHLPEGLHVQVIPSDKAGFVYLYLGDWDTYTINKQQFFKYEELIKYKDDDQFLSQKKIKDWMKSIIDKARDKIMNDCIWSDETIRNRKDSGPAITLFDMYSKMSIDLVAVFRIPGMKWPAYPVRPNPYETESLQDFLVVPKPPKENDILEDPGRYWRLSFPVQEKEIMNDLNFCKPVIRFLKKLRDTHSNIDIPSYFIKTVFLWEIEKLDKSFWNGSFTKVFIKMLEVYTSYIKNKNIPYYWSKENNFLYSNKNSHITNMTDYLEGMIKDIDRNKANPLIVAKYLLPQNEYDEVCMHFEYNFSNSIELQGQSNDNVVSRINDRSEFDSNTDLITGLSDNAEALAFGIGGIALLGVALYKFLSPSTPQRNSNE